MAASMRLQRLLRPQIWALNQVRLSNTVPGPVLDRQRTSRLRHNPDPEEVPYQNVAPPDYKYVYPEFLPNPDWQKRDRIAEKLERKDMLRRRAIIDMPEFYVGSILAVTVSDPYAPGKKNRFVGICIHRSGHGLRANFILRNIVDGEGVEIMYDLYNPTILKMEVLKLEKRLDEELYYLRDAPKEYSTVPFDMDPVPHPPGAPVPINRIQVQLGPIPWHDRWERKELKGAVLPPISETRRIKAERHKKPWEKYDIMKQYRESINEVETESILSEVYSHMSTIEKDHAKRKTRIIKKK